MTMISKFLLSTLLVLTVLSCKQEKSNDFKIKIVGTTQHYGYQIIKGDRIVINQEYIPAVQGEQYFQDSVQAKATAQLVLSKLNKGEFPRIEIEELDSLKIHFNR